MIPFSKLKNINLFFYNNCINFISRAFKLYIVVSRTSLTVIKSATTKGKRNNVENFKFQNICIFTNKFSYYNIK